MMPLQIGICSWPNYFLRLWCGSCRVPKLKLDDVFERKDDIAIAVKAGRWSDDYLWLYNYQYIGLISIRIFKWKNAMNRINAADREKTVAEFEAEASESEL
jgi:hypothetical protein